MLQDRAHTSPRLSGSHRKVWTFFLFSTPLSCAEHKVWGEREKKKRQSAHDDGQLLYLDTKAWLPVHSLTTVCFYFVVAPSPGELAERRALARPPLGVRSPGMHRHA